MVQSSASFTVADRIRLYLQHRFDGGASLRGELDAATTEALRIGLDAFDSGPDPTNGPTPVRSLAERRADALGDMARNAIAGSDEQAAPKSRRVTNLAVDLPTLAGRSRTDMDGIVATLDRRRWLLERRPDGAGWDATSPDGTTWTGRPHERAGPEPPGHTEQAA